MKNIISIKNILVIFCISAFVFGCGKKRAKEDDTYKEIRTSTSYTEMHSGNDGMRFVGESEEQSSQKGQHKVRLELDNK